MIVKREVGPLGTSIGTDEAVAALISESGKMVADTMYINVRTVYRNYYSSLKDDNYKITALDIITEMDVLRKVLAVAIKKVVFYLSTYKSKDTCFKNGAFKVISRDDKDAYSKFEHELNVLDEIYTDSNPIELERFDVKIDGKNTNAYIMTHLPIDLMSSHTFKNLWLFESHTGKVLGKTAWGKKLTGKDMSNMPFNSLTLQLFGDKSKHFKSYPIAVKRAVLDVAAKGKWNPVTTKDKIRSDMKKHLVQSDFELLSKFLNATVK